jgi:putative tryptophan/tyrosine transport system substrate-binding protein
MRRREFIAGLSGAAAWPVAARAQLRDAPLIAFVHGGSASGSSGFAAAFRKGLAEKGYFEGQNIRIEYRWLEGRYDGLPAMMADLVSRRVALIASVGVAIATAAKAATATVPIVFGVGEDPVKLGLVNSLARPNGNATGINFFVGEVVSKRLALLHELVPKAVRVAVLVNPSVVATAESTPREAREAARSIGLQIQALNASTIREVDESFAQAVRGGCDALFVAADAFFSSRSVQFVTLAAFNKIPTSFGDRDIVAPGGLMSYGTNFADTFQQVGVYAASIIGGTKPADLPVQQSTKFDLAINLQTAKLLGISPPPSLLAVADEVIE